MSKNNNYISKEYKAFVDLLNFSNGKYSIRDIFRDFVVMFAIAIKNQFIYSQEDEDMYIGIINTYLDKEREVFPKLICELVKIVSKDDDFKDVLGEIYQQIGANSRINEQFFTPNNVAKLMAEINIDIEKIKSKDYIIISDPTCGSGVLLINAANYLDLKNINYRNKALFVGQDIDFICVCMTYVQMTLYGMAGYVIQGNSLLNEKNKIFYTPEFFIGDWYSKKECA